MPKTSNNKGQTIYSLKSALMREIEQSIRDVIYHQLRFDSYDKLYPNQKITYSVSIEIETDKHGNYTVKHDDI